MILYEHRGSKQRMNHEVRLVDREELENLVGYRSLYGFSPEAVEQIRQNKGTYNLNGFEFYSDELLVDFDNAPEAAEKMEDDLRGYSYTKYDSGGRSIHFHIPIEPMHSAAVPLIQRQWMKHFYPEADESIYKTSGMFRLDGTYHEKNPGKRKRLLDARLGDMLVLGPVPGMEIPIPIWSGEAGDPEMLSKNLDKLLLQEGKPGSRNQHTFKIAATCRDLGEPYQYTIELAKQWNRLMCSPPLSSVEVETTVYSAYRGKV